MGRRFFTWLVTAILIGSGLANAAEVQIGVSAKETYVGLPVTLQIRIDNAEEYRVEEIPRVDGLRIESSGRPSTSTHISRDFRGTTRRSSVTYQYYVTPEREGTFTIPPIKVVVDGLATITKAVRLVATTSETGDLLFVEVTSEDESVYVGEPLDVTLKIWVRPFRDVDREVTLSEANMWGCVSNQTTWGIFTERMTELEQNRQRPGGREVLREDNDGNERQYYLYEIGAKIYPDRPGTLDAKELKIALTYPVALGRARSTFDDMFEEMRARASRFGDSFGSRLAITSVRPIVAETTVAPIEILPIPTQGRPDDYRGAVGEYTIEVAATPGRVAAGDPITLRIGIAGTGPLALVRAPPLSLQEDLTSDFRVGSEELPGYVSGDTKQFATTIRPRDEQVTEIPPIRFSYFDPDTEQFVTIVSEKIDIVVDAAEALSLDSIIDSGPGAKPVKTPDSLAARPAPAVFSGMDALVSKSPAVAFPLGLWFVLASPPFAFILFFLVMRQDQLQRLAARFTSARRRCLAGIESAETFESIGESLEQLLLRRFPPPDGLHPRSWAIGQIRACGETNLAIRIERAFSECDKAVYAGPTGSASLEEAKANATTLVGDIMEVKKIRVRERRGSQKPGLTAILFAASLALGGGETRASESEDVLTLLPEQQRAILQEANQLYADAESSSPAAAKEIYLAAAEKYAFLVASGITNDKLYFNLATAQLGGKQYGLAIANYRRALRLEPAEAAYLRALATAEQELSESRSEAVTPLSLVDSVRRYNRLVLARLTPRVVFLSTAVCWLAFWVVIAMRTVRSGFAYKSVAALLLLIFLVNASSYLGSVHEFTRPDVAVLSHDGVSLRSGDGEDFPVVIELADSEGLRVQTLQSRDGWIKIRVQDDRIGWVKSEAAEVI